jgi:hypothetical protein
MPGHLADEIRLHPLGDFEDLPQTMLERIERLVHRDDRPPPEAGLWRTTTMTGRSQERRIAPR